MAAIIVMGPLVVALAVVLAITWPEVPVVPLLAVFLPAGLVLPIVLYPVSYTMWQAVDIVMRPVTAADLAPADPGVRVEADAGDDDADDGRPSGS